MNRRSVLCLLVLSGLLLLLYGYRHSVSFTVSPSQYSQCNGPNVRVHVAWKLPRDIKLPITIYVSGVGRPAKAWYSAYERTGEQTTGEWMADGSSLMLRDGHGWLLARRTITSEDCVVNGG